MNQRTRRNRKELIHGISGAREGQRQIKNTKLTQKILARRKNLEKLRQAGKNDYKYVQIYTNHSTAKQNPHQKTL